MDELYCDLLLLVKKAPKNEIPIAAIVLDENNRIIAKSTNKREKKHDITGHAEILALKKACKKKKTWKLDKCKLIVSLEPCMMCMGAILQSRIAKLIYFVENPRTGFVFSNHTFDISKLKVEKISNNEYTKQFKTTMNEFFVKLR